MKRFANIVIKGTQVNKHFVPKSNNFLNEKKIVDKNLQIMFTFCNADFGSGSFKSELETKKMHQNFMEFLILNLKELQIIV